jgi:Protein of unknown function (DUF3592)
VQAEIVLGILFLAVGGSLAIAALGRAFRRRAFLRASARTTGEVVGLAMVAGRPEPAFFPKIAFRTPSGRSVTFETGLGSSEPAFVVGQSVAVRYREDDPNRAELDSFLALWGTTVVFGALGFGFALVGAGLILGWIPL